MQHVIKGSVLPVLEMELSPGEKLIAETGELAWMTDNISMRTAITGISGNAGQRGLMGAVKRAISGGSLFMTEYSNAANAPGLIVFASKFPGTIMPIELSHGQSYLVHRHGFVCGTEGVQLEMAVQRSMGSGFLGRVGFLLQRVSGPGTAFIELSGELTQYDLDPGERLLIHPGHVGMLEPSVGYDVVTVPGLKNKFFSGDGLFLLSLTGPGKIWLQSTTIANLAHALIPYMPAGSE
ncbi:MAG: TIGR00266 family protein [Solirubrobacteraceae bacterium]